jgi:O-antigen ligase
MATGLALLASAGTLSVRAHTREVGLALCTLFFLTTAGAMAGLAALFVGMSWHGRTSLIITFLWLITFPLIAISLRNWGPLMSLARGIPLVLFGGVAIASSTWSPVPGATLSLAVLMTGVILNGLMLGGLAGWRSLITGLAIATTILGVLALLLIPVGGRMDADMNFALRGAWPEKNEAGSVFALGAIACFMVAKFNRQPLWLIACVFQLGVIVLTQSVTSLGAAMIGIATLAVIHVIGSGPRRLVVGLWAILVIGGAIAFALITRFEDVIGLFGRDTTFTGRSNIWPPLLARFEDQPWLGYGYGSFWDPGNPLRDALYDEVKFEVFSAHNTAIEILIGMGLVGLSLMVAGLIVFLVGALSRLHRPGDPQRDGLAFLLAFLVLGATESALTGPEGLTLTLLATLLGRTRFRTRTSTAG